jgi:nucleoside-diphosphate-sugar epimerase
MNILITGITGFIGSAVAEHLAMTGHTVHAIVREKSDTCDIKKKISIHRHNGSTEQLCELMQKIAPDVVFHFASMYLADHKVTQISELFRSNVEFPSQLLEAMKQSNITQFINTGTCWQHYESSAVRPVNLYAATKQAFEVVLDYYHDAHNISSVTLKLCDTYGPNDKRKKLINILLNAAHTQEKLNMSLGEQIIDLTHIEDIVSAYECAMVLIGGASDKKISEKYLISGSRHTLKEVVNIVSEVTSTPINADFGKRPYRFREVMMPSDACELKLPGWTPGFNLRSGLLKMINAMKND